ncbi:hypothetical protein LSH36_147g07011 [Paralvinella palmiformis]|uniref:Growth arrest-specific protein 1 n=1 Tax=Paralvinella palmiformis TaxID=53620 RepID=A0AAD9JX18_9ANNE|nr:hypothetical protein LSH36_147g07011 [Paralvinella palmiformis]
MVRLGINALSQHGHYVSVCLTYLDARLGYNSVATPTYRSRGGRSRVVATEQLLVDSCAWTATSRAGPPSMFLRMTSPGAATRSSTSATPKPNGHSLVYRSLISILMLILAVMDVASARGRGNGNGRVKLCSEVHNRCFGRDGCKFALENYFLHCMDLSDAPPTRCSHRCKMALIMLLSSEEHDGPNAFRECDCQGEEFCLQQKERIAVCQEDVQMWLDAISDPRVPISCSLATMVCSADSTCLMAIDYYEDHCKRLQDANNPRCTSRCNNSLNILYRQDKAEKLQTCYCDGTEGYNCTALKRNMQELCFRGSSTPRIRHPVEHDHTRRTGARGHTTPPLVDFGGVGNDDDELDTSSLDNSIEQDFRALGSSSLHNSAYTIHSNACASHWLNHRQSTQLTLTVTVLLYLLTDR